MTKILSTVFAASAIAASAHAGTTLIGSNESGQNTTVPLTFGSNAAANDPGRIAVTDGGTPNIALQWIAPGVSQQVWEFHNWGGAGSNDGGNGVYQLNASSGFGAGDPDPFVRNVVHSIEFTPDGGFGVQLDGFNFIGDTNGDTYQYDWRVVKVGDSSVVASGQTVQWTTNTATAPYSAAPAVTINYTGALGEALRLDLAQSIGSTGNGVNIAIDNVAFDQVPEPSSLALLGLGGLLIARRRKV